MFLVGILGSYKPRGTTEKKKGRNKKTSETLSYKVLQTLGRKDFTKGKEMMVSGSKRLHETVGFGSKKTIRLIRMLKHTLLVGMNMSTVLNTLDNKYQGQNVPSKGNDW